MLRRALLAGLVALSACSSGTSPPAQPAAGNLQFRLRDFHLRSGLRLIVEEDHDAPVAGVVCVVGSGSTADPPGKEGLAHLVEHLTYRAKPAPERDWKGFLDQAGAAVWNGTTGFDSTEYWEFGPRDTLLDLLKLEGMRIIDPLAGVDEKTFAVEREVVRNELRWRGETHVIGSTWSAVLAALYPASHPYARAPIGSHESISSLTLEDARAFVKEHYRPANMTMLVIGDVRLESFEKLLEQALSPSLNEPSAGPIVKGSRLAPQPPEPPAPPPSNGLPTLEGAVPAPELYIAWSLPRSFDESSYLGELALRGANAAVEAADDEDTDIVYGSALLDSGVEATTLLLRVVLSQGSHPQASAQHVLNALYYNWETAESAMVEEARFVHHVGRAATLTLLEAEDVVSRGVARAEISHFSGDPAIYSHNFQALRSIDRGKLGAYYYRYLNRDRARMVLVRPLPADRRPPPGRTGIARIIDSSVPIKYDLASLDRIAVPVGFASNFQSVHLDNGLTVEATRRGTTPIVSIGLGLRGGTADEPSQGAARLSRLWAFVDRPRHGPFAEHAAVLTSRATVDSLEFRVRAPASQLDAVLRILADHVQSLRVHASTLGDFERFRLPYIRQSDNQPENVADRAFRHALFQSHPFAHTDEMPAGKVPDVGDANDWMARASAPSHALLAIAGPIDPAEAIKLARQAFSDWSGPVGFTDPPPLGEEGPSTVIVTQRAGATQTELKLGCRLPAALPANPVAHEVLARAVDARFGTIRRETGTTYDFSAKSSVLRGGTTVLLIQGAVENAGLAGALRTLHRGLAESDWTQAIDEGKWALAREFNMGLATPDDWVGRALAVGHYGWELTSVDQIPASISSVDGKRLVASLNRCAREGVLSLVGDEPIIRRALANAWH